MHAPQAEETASGSLQHIRIELTREAFWVFLMLQNSADKATEITEVAEPKLPIGEITEIAKPKFVKIMK